MYNFISKKLLNVPRSFSLAYCDELEYFFKMKIRISVAMLRFEI